MTDLAKSTWLEIAKQSVYLPQDAQDCVGRYIAVDALRRILRKSRRSGEQNRLLWSIYGDILALGGEALGGFTREDLHEFFLIDHFGSERKELFGRARLKPLRRSSKLTKTEFSDFIEHIVRFAAERGIVLSLPGDVPDDSSSARRPSSGPEGSEQPTVPPQDRALSAGGAFCAQTVGLSQRIEGA